MRILAVVPAYPPVSMVGAWCATHLFLRHLADLGHKVQAFAYGQRVDGYTHEGVEVVTAAMGRPYALNMARDGAELVISHAGDGGIGSEVAQRTGLPSVRMVHGLQRDSVGAADLFVFNSDNLRRSVSHEGPSVVCHPPVDIGHWRVDRTVADRVTLIGLSPDKGVKTLAALARQMPDRRFLGVHGGYGPQRPPTLPNVEVLGHVTDLRPVYARTRALLMPSRVETWGMTAVEAMAAGIPVIAHPTAGLRESLGRAGIFADRDNTRAWHEALLRLDDPQAYARASAEASARAAELDPAQSLSEFIRAIEGVVA
ncbi:glycosyltransferase family 4 protein [Mycolicibacterium sp.]|uniref:glycosyltransferase family 4 protein n=1 Tax=Mycolicibacterium sp. TaxID=2320850 RepID=UPI00355E72B8